MVIDTYLAEQFWKLEKPKVPARSRLYHLEPVGLETIWVESLTSYIARLAEHHQVTTEKLVLTEIAPRMIQKGYKAGSRSINRLFRVYESLAECNETRGLIATTLIQALEELTLRSDLSHLSVLKEASQLFKFSQLYRRQSWCPVCYQEWLMAGRVIYNPLIWLIRDNQTCLHHKQQALVDECPYCRKQFPPLTKHSRPGYCSRCRKWLGYSPQSEALDSQDSPDREFLWESLIVKRSDLVWQFMWLDNVGDLVANTPASFLPPKRVEIGSARQAVGSSFKG